jgi:hypothetical protein|tara:strand:- start:1362 stop:1781 length:420 start_codon:yes stop_codon:yes gene_type:complete
MGQFLGLEFTLLEQGLIVGMVLLVSLVVITWRRLARLEARFVLSQAQSMRELKMLNQSAIGVGRRLAGIEKNSKKSSNVSSFAEAQELKQSTVNRFADVQKAVASASQAEAPLAREVNVGLTTRAEQALSSWINENKTA